MTNTSSINRLAVYGTLAPGESNYNQISSLKGTWSKGKLNGRIIEQEWCSLPGHFGLILDSDGPTIDVEIFESDELPAHLARLDEFEGPGYKRVETPVRTETNTVSAWIYVTSKEE